MGAERMNLNLAISKTRFSSNSGDKDMSLTSIKRTFRKIDWLVRCAVLLLIGGCLSTLLTWAWSNSTLSYMIRSDLQFTPQYISITNDFQLLNEQSSSCLPCPNPQLDMSVTENDSGMQLINCTINDAEVIKCREDRGEVYMPVTFINNYFEVFGSVKKDGTSKLYNFQHSYGNIYPIQPVYHPGGVFLNFNKYNVEQREMIMCVTASDGVPLVSQWDPAGYFYAITVAQYGLSHHAKGMLDGNPVPKLLAGGKLDPSGWENIGPGIVVKVLDTMTEAGIRKVLSFSAPESLASPGPVLQLKSKEHTICMDLQLSGTGGFTVKIKTKEGKIGYIHYHLSDRYMTINGSQVIYGLSEKNLGKWMHLARDIYIDWMKALGRTKYNAPTRLMEVIDLTLHGTGFLDNLTIAVSAHNDHLIHAAEWLVKNQDHMGGWSTRIGMKTGENIELKPGWYSAMGQGQAMSTLVRAFNLTGQKHYLETAVRALHLYELSAEEGGVTARFLGQLDWYEEYPTTPTSTFVLNGFIFAMLGLYDVMKTVEGRGQKLAEQLWTSGLHSLKRMLGMYDSGTGTLYDLRHIINHEQPNRARWDYHTTHIALIQEMALIDGDPLFNNTANRWINYFYGKKSKHN